MGGYDTRVYVLGKGEYMKDISELYGVYIYMYLYVVIFDHYCYYFIAVQNGVSKCSIVFTFLK